jgi:hypothetical protein
MTIRSNSGGTGSDDTFGPDPGNLPDTGGWSSSSVSARSASCNT